MSENKPLTGDPHNSADFHQIIRQLADLVFDTAMAKAEESGRQYCNPELIIQAIATAAVKTMVALITAAKADAAASKKDFLDMINDTFDRSLQALKDHKTRN